MISSLTKKALCVIFALTALSLGSTAPEKPVHVDSKILSKYVGVYRWAPNHFLYIQFWDELGKDQLGAFDESGEIRAPICPGSRPILCGKRSCVANAGGGPNSF